MIPLPRLSMNSIGDYLALGAGLIVGFTIFEGPMNALESGLRRQG